MRQQINFMGTELCVERKLWGITGNAPVIHPQFVFVRSILTPENKLLPLNTEFINTNSPFI
jgi:hypothetical protein